MQTHPPKPPLPPFLALAFGILAVSTASIFIRYAQVHAASLVIAAYRLVLATLVLAPLALYRYWGELRLVRGRRLGLALLSGFFLGLHFASWITSLEYTSVTSSVVIVTTSPLWVALLSPLVLHEPVRRIVLVGMTLALTGGLIVGISDACTWGRAGLTCPDLGEMVQGQAFLGDILALVGAWMAGLYLLIGRQLRAGMSLISYIFVVYGMAAVTLVLLVVGWQAFGLAAAGQLTLPLFGQSLQSSLFGYPPVAFLWFILLALVPQLLGHSTFNWALRYLSAAYVSITLLGEPIGSSILAYFFLQEAPGALKLIGAILILLGIYVASRTESEAA